MTSIAYLGPEGTVSEESVRYFFASRDVVLVPCASIEEVFTFVARGKADYSAIPVENTIEGSVGLHIDWLVHKVDLPIRAEWVYPSVQNLIGAKRGGQGLSWIRKVLSIDVAIAQCRHFLNEELPDVEFAYVRSTAEGVKIVADNPDQPWAAIGTKLAAAHYGLDVLRENIADHNNNFTRFILIGKKVLEGLPQADRFKTSILVTLPEDYPGALHQVLSAFAWRRINLSKIESRPTKKKLGNYYFYIDIEESMESVLLPAAIAEIEAIGCHVRILGSYPSYSYKPGGAL